jgi:hypothetical protein
LLLLIIQIKRKNEFILRVLSWLKEIDDHLQIGVRLELAMMMESKALMSMVWITRSCSLSHNLGCEQIKNRPNE